jgi:hypothetical protein
VGEALGGGEWRRTGTALGVELPARRGLSKRMGELSTVGVHKCPAARAALVSGRMGTPCGSQCGIGFCERMAIVPLSALARPALPIINGGIYYHR